jgi:hypothetical protein
VVNRAILFMVKKDEVRGLGQFGIELKISLLTRSYAI